MTNKLLYFYSSENVSLIQVKDDLSSIEVILGTLTISGWGEEVFDYLPNLMFIGGFEGQSALVDGAYDSLAIHDNTPSHNPAVISVSLTQIHFPKLVEISGLDIFVANNPTLCYIGELEYYKASRNQTVIYTDTLNISAIGRRPYSECGK